jgi:hypothetical protein
VIIEKPDGIKIAAFFILTILLKGAIGILLGEIRFGASAPASAAAAGAE